jgi:phosphohistidine swiveling domain-containing protein
MQYRKAASPAGAQTGTGALSRKLGLAAQRAAKLQVLKEDAKHVVLMELSEIRRVLLAIDRRFDLGGCIFHLTLDEALWLDAGSRDRMLARATQRRIERQALALLPPLPPDLTLVELEKATRGHGIVSGERNQGQAGTRVAGRRVVDGRALLITPAQAETGQPPDGFRDGDIIVTPMLHPGWLPFLLRAGGVVSEVGGWLSHMAIVARERDVAMIVGIDAPPGLGTGDRVRLHLDGRVEVLNEGMCGAPCVAAE